MTTTLKQSTQVIVRVGPFVDVGDGFTPETAVTLTGGGDNADEAEVMKAGGGASVDISARTWAAVTGCDGWYDLTLSTADTGTVGDLTVVIQNDSVHLPVHARFQVVEEAIYDALYGAAADGFDASGNVTLAAVTHTGAVIPTVTTVTTTTTATNVTNISTGGIVAASFAAGAIDNAAFNVTETLTANPAAGGIAAASFAAGAIDAAAIANGAIDAATFAAGAIDAAAIGTGAIDADAIATDAITSAKIAAGAITSSEAPNLDAAISTRATPAQVNFEVSDVLKTDTLTLPVQGTPTATPTMEAILGWLYKAFRNKSDQNATTWQLYDDAGTVVDHKATLSESGGTVTKNKIQSGP